jgi:hypothetical protein
MKLRDVLIGVALTVVTFFGALYQVNESQATDSELPRLICPLH